MVGGLARLFYLIMWTAYWLHKTDPNFDGLATWKPIKAILEEYDNSLVASRWICPKIEEWEKCTDHHMTQIAGIPLRAPPTLLRIAQIAYNIGILRAKTTEKERARLGLVQAHSRLETYVSSFDIDSMSERMPIDILDRLRLCLAAA